MNVSVIVAKIKECNAPSLALFAKLGYTEFKRIEVFEEIHYAKGLAQPL